MWILITSARSRPDGWTGKVGAVAVGGNCEPGVPHDCAPRTDHHLVNSPRQRAESAADGDSRQAVSVKHGNDLREMIRGWFARDAELYCCRRTPARRAGLKSENSHQNEVEMRRLLLLSAVTVASACADNQQPTAPARARSAGPTSSAAGQLAPSSQGKPTDQVGFTTLTIVETTTTIAVGQGGGAVALCPVGDQVSGGGYSTSGTGTPPYIGRSSMTTSGSQNGWIVLAENTAPGAGAITMRVSVHCVH